MAKLDADLLTDRQLRTRRRRHATEYQAAARVVDGAASVGQELATTILGQLRTTGQITPVLNLVATGRGLLINQQLVTGADTDLAILHLQRQVFQVRVHNTAIKTLNTVSRSVPKTTDHHQMEGFLLTLQARQ